MKRKKGEEKVTTQVSVSKNANCYIGKDRAEREKSEGEEKPMWLE